jgi:hypothetical protein
VTQIASLARRNQPHALALIEATYRQAGAAMRLFMSFLLAHPRVVKAGVRVGALVLLFYAASFYTRDWRPVVAQPDQPALGQAATRSKAESRSLPSKLADLPVLVEPATTGAVTRITRTAVAPSAEPTDTRRLASAPPRSKARPVAPRSVVRHKPSKRTQVAARPVAVEEPSPVRLPPSAVETPIQFRLADRGGDN